MPEILNCMLAAETVTQHCCQPCKTVDAVVRCLDCVPSGDQVFCLKCDSEIHKIVFLHDREAMFDVFLKPDLTTSLVVVDESGQYQLSEQGMFR